MVLDLQGFKRTLVYQSTQPAASVQADIEELRGQAPLFEGLERRWRRFMVLGWILAIGLLILAAVRAEKGDATLWFILGTCAAGWAIVATVQKRRLSRLNVADRRYELLSGLLGLLQADLGQAAVGVRLDLGRPDLKPKFSGKGQTGPWKVAHYTDPWLDLQGRLLDGTQFHFTATERFEHRSRWKRSQRGKMKHKTKTRSSTRFGLDLAPKAGRCPGLEAAAADAADALRLPDAFTLKRFQVASDRLALRVAAGDAWSAARSGQQPGGPDGVEAGALMFLSLYEIVRRAGRPANA